MKYEELEELVEWGKDITTINGLVLVKVLMSTKDGFDLNLDNLIVIPEHLKKHLNPFTLSIVLSEGTGYRNQKTGEWEGPQFKCMDVLLSKQHVGYALEYDGRKVNYIPESTVLLVVDESIEDILKATESQ